MDNNSDRRAFFKNIISSASHFLSPLGPLDRTDHESGDQSGGRLNMTSQIMGDLTPELLAMEAQRLGLDPQKDRDRVFQSIQAAMGRPDMKGSSG